MLLVFFARAFTRFRLIDKRTISLAIPTIIIIAIVWLSQIYPDAAGTDFTFESIYKAPRGLPVVEAIMLFLWCTTLTFLIRMLFYSRALWNTSKALAIKTLLLGISGTGTFLIYSIEVTMWFSIEFYIQFMLVMAIMASISFFVPKSWFERLLKAS
jgi:hypothetical protein